MSTMRVADYAMSFVAQIGVKAVFLVPGGGSMHMVDALAQRNDIIAVPNHHEQASAIAAEAYARVAEGPGVALVTTGPGATNAITGVAGAWIESVPLIVISGQVKRADMMGTSGVRQMGPQEVDIVSIIRPITKYAVTVMEPKSIRYHLERALYEATDGRQGPVWIDVPLDVQAAQIDPAALQGFDAPGGSSQASDALERKAAEILDLINKAERPLILAGHGVRLAGAAKEFGELYEILGVPVVTTWNAMDLIPADHPLSVGRPGTVALRPPNFAVQNSDLLLAIGARMDNVVTAYNPARFARHARKIMVDIDPAELNKFEIKPAMLVQAHARDFVRALLKAAKARAGKEHGKWLARCQDWKKRYPIADGKVFPDSGPITHSHFVKTLAEEIPPDALIVTGSSGLAVESFYLGFSNKPGQRVFLTSGLGAMGYGLPAIIGASMAAPGRPIVGFEGDGSLQMNLQELLTIREFDIPVRLFIANNSGYASIRATQKNYFAGRYLGTGPEAHLRLPDLVKLSEVIGIPAMRIADISEMREKIRQTLAQPGPFLCDVSLVHNETLWPRSSAIIQPDGSMVSMPLEDMSPLLPRDELRANMLVPLDPASENVHPSLIARGA